MFADWSRFDSLDVSSLVLYCGKLCLLGLGVVRLALGLFCSNESNR